jgi:hypothetical protein
VKLEKVAGKRNPKWKLENVDEKWNSTETENVCVEILLRK